MGTQRPEFAMEGDLAQIRHLWIPLPFFFPINTNSASKSYAPLSFLESPNTDTGLFQNFIPSGGLDRPFMKW